MATLIPAMGSCVARMTSGARVFSVAATRATQRLGIGVGGDEV